MDEHQSAEVADAHRMKVTRHHGHVYCGGLCVPGFLHEQFAEQLGLQVDVFDLLTWYGRRDAQRKREGVVIDEPLTWWRDQFRAELRARGWTKPWLRRVPPSGGHVSPMGIVSPCPHVPACATTWSCGQRQLAAMWETL